MSFESSKKTPTQKLANKSPKSHIFYECFFNKNVWQATLNKNNAYQFFKRKMSGFHDPSSESGRLLESLLDSLNNSREGDRHRAFEFVARIVWKDTEKV